MDIDLDYIVSGLDAEPAAGAPGVPAAPALTAPAKSAPAAKPAPEKPGMVQSALAFLKAKRGPLPTYGWGLIGAGALAGIVAAVKLRKRY